MDSALDRRLLHSHRAGGRVSGKLPRTNIQSHSEGGALVSESPWEGPTSYRYRSRNSWILEDMDHEECVALQFSYTLQHPGMCCADSAPEPTSLPEEALIAGKPKTLSCSQEHACEKELACRRSVMRDRSHYHHPSSSRWPSTKVNLFLL